MRFIPGCFFRLQFDGTDASFLRTSFSELPDNGNDRAIVAGFYCTACF